MTWRRVLRCVGAVLASLPVLAAGQRGGATPPQPTTVAGATPYVFKQIGSVELRLYVFSPPPAAPRPRPAIVFFFGGGWTTGNVEQFASRARHSQQQGMVAVLADYRVYSRQHSTAFDSMADAKSAIRWVRAHASELGVDPNRIVASGGSAGGHLALSAAVFDTFDEPAEDQAVSSKPNALLLFNPSVDTTHGSPPELHDRFGSRQTDGSPAHHLRAGLPPMLIMHGTADQVVPVKDVEKFCGDVKRLGTDCRLVTYPGAGHGFFGDPQWYPQTLAESDKFLASLGYVRPRGSADPTPAAEPADAPAPPPESGPATPPRMSRTPPAAPAPQPSGSPVFRSATLEAYQSVANRISGAAYVVRESNDYAVTLLQGETRVKSFTHKSVSSNTQPREAVARQASWTQFSFGGAVDVEVRSLRGSIRSLEVLPSRLAIPVERAASDGRRLRLTQPAKLALVVNGDDRNPLFVYASAMPAEREPAPAEAGVVLVEPGRHDRATVATYSGARVLAFQPGVHLLDDALTVRPGQHVHLSAGSFVLGQIVGVAPTFAGLRIDGRGVLSGQHHGPLNFRDGTLILLNGGAAFQARIPYQVEISGITLADQPSFAIRLYSVPYVHIAGINVGPGWYFRTDGIESGPHTLVEDVFLNCNDDSVKLIFGDSEWRRLTIWQGPNGAAVQFSWNTDHETKNVSVHDVDIVHVSTFHDAVNHAVFGSMHAGSGYVHDIRIENVTVEGPVLRLFRIGTFYTHDAIRENGQAGGIGDISFRNVTVAAVPSEPSDFLLCQNAGASGKCPSTFLGPITFENLRIAGRPIRSLDDLKATVEPGNRAKIVFR